MLKGCVIGLGAMGSNHVRVLHEPIVFVKNFTVIFAGEL